MFRQIDPGLVLEQVLDLSGILASRPLWRFPTIKDHLEEFRLSVERDPEAFKRSIKCLREQFLGSKQLQLLMSATGLDVGALAQGQATCASLRVE